MESIDFIKKMLDNFILESIKENKRIGFKDGSETNLNKAVYEIQNHFSNELRAHNINTQLNPEIISTAILKSFNDSNVKANPKENYEYPFLKYIALEFRPTTELNEYIDSFLWKNKDQLSWDDLVITKTGATRCKTNIRFAINDLRKLMLIRNRNKVDKRTVLPTVLGHLVVLYFDYLRIKFQTYLKTEERISSNGFLEFHSQLNSLKNPLNLSGFLGYIMETQPLSISDRTKTERYLKLFIEIILENITLSEKSVRFDEKIINEKEYLQLLNEMAEEYINFDFSRIN